jgi:hypothetical protein
MRAAADNDLADHYEVLNADASGEYRAKKYERALGKHHPDLPDITSTNDAETSIGDLLVQLESQGVVVLKNVLPKSVVERANAAHNALIADVQPQIDDLQQVAYGDPSHRNQSFYKGGERDVGGLRIRTTAKGRIDLKSLDRRDQGAYVTEKHPGLADAMEPLVMPPIVTEMLQRSMGTQYRMTTFGTLPTQPHAVGGDWHRDIGEGLFGEDNDIKLPDYYFNALIPLHNNPERDAEVRNGTEFLLGSHRCGMDELDKCQRVMASGKVGDIIFFNGKLVHRGCPNMSSVARNMVYVVYSAKWFQQNRDPKGEVAYQSTQMPAGTREISKARL